MVLKWQSQEILEMKKDGEVARARLGIHMLFTSRLELSRLHSKQAHPSRSPDRQISCRNSNGSPQSELMQTPYKSASLPASASSCAILIFRAAT